MTHAMPYLLHADPATDRAEWVPLGARPTRRPAAENRPGPPSDRAAVIEGKAAAVDAPEGDADTFVWA